ncbi:hypothetical protein GE061_011723 [Apolygus lucorum]|uniref:Solute carrier organic anion transporter family member n=1 Tax=Apolygus lucorum TaxID=248454 RepID=A0A6A4K5T0_APOLU|nr:hypothetical protein GE061_011723 [Apolygus lucorum]
MTDSKKDAEATKGMMGETPGEPELNDDTTCGIWFIKGPFLQKFANKKAFVILNGIMGLVMTASYVYFGNTISTIEKRFKLNSRTTGFITVGNDISTLMFGAFITYYAGKRGHKPRWIALGVYTVVLFCILNGLPHLLYGSGEDALMLTSEYGGTGEMNASVTQDILERHNKQMLCQNKPGASVKCVEEDGGYGPTIILFAAQFISGLGGSLYYTLGTTYMDDNIKKSKTPALISISYFIRMLGPAIGASLSGYCLSLYISPKLHPKINNRDPRWLGAWWLGWIVLSVAMFIMASLVALFPRHLPRAYVRRQQSRQSANETKTDEAPSIKDFFVTIKRLCKNKILMCNNFAGIFYLVGYMPFWTFGTKYAEIMFKQSAAKASFVTGTIGLGFAAAGLLSSGLVLSKFKPSARKMALWNVFVSVLSVCGLISYGFLGCLTDDQKGLSETSNELQTTFECNADCHCDFVKYSPVCSYGETFISPCHAGCQNYVTFPNGSKIFTDCSCVKNQTASGDPLPSVANPGPCPADCEGRFHIFLAIVCVLKFFGASGRATNFLVAMRCVDEKDKPASMGFGSFLVSLLAFIPSPIIFGYIIDTTCLVWGRTCTGNGNCWLYNAHQLRYVLCFSAAFFVGIGTLFDTGVWYLVKDLNVFDEDEDEGKDDTKTGKEMQDLKNGKPKYEIVPKEDKNVKS